jgi:trehalose synthase
MRTALTSVEVGSLPLDRFESILSPQQAAHLGEAVARSRRVLDGRVVWNLNSTARGGGVAEMLVSLLAYARGLGVDVRWQVIAGEPDFFTITKRIHNHLHSAPGDGGPLGEEERAVYEAALVPNAQELIERVNRDDVVIVHDPQPAGLIPALKEKLGVPVIWRCHVGIDVPSDLARQAWQFLTPYVSQADACVFSREAFVWEGLEESRVELIAPVIDAFSAKNQELDQATVRAILSAAGIEHSGEDARSDPAFTREDGTVARVRRRAQVTEEAPVRPEDPVVLQVSRWDRLKDQIGRAHV